MKTPRELLLEKHRAANPALDNVRRQALDAIFLPPTPTRVLRSFLAELSRKLWAELIWPNRKTWAGLTALWLVVLGLTLACQMDGSGPVYASAEPLSPETVVALHQQRQELAELVQSSPSEPAEPPQRAPQPRSFVQPNWMIG